MAAKTRSNKKQDNNNLEEESSNGEAGEEEESMLCNTAGSAQDDEEVEEEYEIEEHENGAEDNAATSTTGADEEEADDEDGQTDEVKANNRTKSSIIKTRYLWVSNVPAGTRSQQLEELFEKHAKILAIKIIRGTGSSLLAFVKLENIEQAQKCYEKLNKTEFKGSKLELSKERPSASANAQASERRDTRVRSRPNSFRPPYRSSRGSPSTYRHNDAPSSRERRGEARFGEFRSRSEREEMVRIEREKEKLKLERLKLERDRLELLKMRTYADQRPKLHDDKRRNIESLFVDDKRGGDYHDYGRREEYSSRKLESERKPYAASMSRSSYGTSSRGRYDDNGRGHERYESGGNSSHIYRGAPMQSSSSSSSWQQQSSSSGDHPRWHQSSSGYDSARGLVANSLGSSSSTRSHHQSSDVGISSRNYFSASSRRY